MNAPDDDEGGGAVDDEEAARRFPKEISFRGTTHHRRACGFFDDDDTVPSELSTLLAPSTLTPTYAPVAGRDDGGPGRLPGPPEAGSRRSGGSRTRTAFQLAALVGFFSVLALLGAGAGAGARARRASSSPPPAADALDRDERTAARWSGGGGASKIPREGKAKKKAKANKEGDGTQDDAGPSTREGAEGDEEELVVAAATTKGEAARDGPALVSSEDGGGGRVHQHGVAVPEARERCPHVVDTFAAQNEGIVDRDDLREKYLAQSVDVNVFYRATALLFWKDFGAGLWGREEGRSVDLNDLVLLREARYEDGTPLSPMSTWTWITGDQHLSNFGAWRNRGGEVVYSVNDFDEGAIYDFHMDVLRIAVSICQHGFTNGLDEEQVREALGGFAHTYVKTAIDYVGGDAALVYELTPDTATGALRDFLWDVREKRSKERLMDKFTEIDDNGARRFSRNDRTRLEDAPADVEEEIRAAITPLRYGASMMKMGWKVRGWDDDFFQVLDVARRVGSGVGSYGVDRFYVMLKGEDTLTEEEGSPVILDVKYEPPSAVSTVLNETDPEVRAWYRDMFRNEADRAARAQVALTSYTDPYVGYLVLGGDPGGSYNVRQRSPYKSSFDLGTLTDHREFNEFMEQIAVATATAHVRGTVAKSPGQFKHVIKVLLAGGRNRKRWSDLVANIALSYRKQVLLDFECFKQYVDSNFP